LTEQLRPSVAGILLSEVVDTPQTACIPPKARSKAGKTFAIVIDGAHSSKGGKTSAAMSEVLGASVEDERRWPRPRRYGDRSPREAAGGGATALQTVEEILISIR
jgi:hypothetical protein